MVLLDKIIDLISGENDSKRLTKYELLRIDLEKAEEVLDGLAEDFAIEKSDYEERIGSDTNGSIRDRIDSKFEDFKSYHKKRVVMAKSIVDNISRKIQKMESSKKDDLISKAVNDRKLAAYGVIKKAYKIGELTRDGFDTAIKKITKDKKVKYADFLLFNEEGDILLLKRSDWEDSNAGAWVLPGGHVDPGEEFHEAAVRELVEEAGFSVDECENCGSYQDENVHIEYFRGVVNSKDHVPVLQWEEIRDSRWVPLDEIVDYTMVFNMKENILKILGLEEQPKVNIRKKDRENISKAFAAFAAIEETGDQDLINKAYKDLSKYIKTKRLVTRDGKTFFMTVYLRKDTGEVVSEVESKELGSFKDIADVNLGSKVQIERFVKYKKEVGEYTLQNVHMSPGREPVISVLNDKGEVKYFSMNTIRSLKTMTSAPTTPPSKPTEPKPEPKSKYDKVLVSEMTFVKELGGSSGVRLMSHPNGKTYAVKKPHKGDAEQVKQEVKVDELYKEFGFEAPNSTYDSVEKAKISEFVTGAKELRSVPMDDKLKKEIQKGFVLDCLLGNWDVVGSAKDNILIKDGKPIRIDNGGSLNYRARGGTKVFDSNVGEIDTMRSTPPASEVFGSISDEEIKHQIFAIGLKRDKFDTLKQGDYPTLKSYEQIKILNERLDSVAKRYGVSIPPKVEPGTPVKPKEPVKPKGPVLRSDMPSMVTQEYFDSKEWTDLKVGGNPGIKEHIKAHIIKIEKKNYDVYSKIAHDEGITIEQVKANMLKWTTEIVARSKPYIVAHSGESKSPDREGSVIQKILKGGRFKSQFETGGSCGSHAPSSRSDTEHGYFGFKDDIHHEKENRPVYGFFTDRDHGVINDKGTIPPSRTVRQYGDVCFEVKDTKKNDVTVTFQDSLGSESYIAATPYNKPHFTSLRTNDSSAYSKLKAMHAGKVNGGLGGSSYVECQYHNKLSLGDVEKVHVTAGQYGGDHKKLSGVINEVIHAVAMSGNKIDIEIF